MITEDYVSYEVAKLLKQKGFDVYTPTRYDYDGGFHSHGDYLIGDSDISAPTHQMAMKWLREKHIIIVVQPEYFNGGSVCSYWGVDLWADDNYKKLQGDFPSYEEACEAALKYSLENLI